MELSSGHRCFILGQPWCWWCQVQNAQSPTKWNWHQPDSHISTPCCCVGLQIVQTMSLHFWKKCPFGFLKIVATLGQNWLSRYTCSQDFQREKCSVLVYVIQPDRTHGSLGLKGKGQENYYFQFCVTLVTRGTCWNNRTQRKSFCVKLGGFESCYTEYFMILSRPLLITWPEGAAKASFLWRLNISNCRETPRDAVLLNLGL